ncbi:MAG: hydroxymethylbilane synthase [Gemmatimonadaceae bacterium]|nr:hydroxymethylbilane synthase [Gemmatimonadaceae bacterium]
MSTASRLLKIGTRSSALALAQAHQVQAELTAIGVTSELVTYTTVGDRRLDVALTAIGSKGLFTEELERDLRDGVTDLCVHSLKDLPTDDPVGLTVIAQLPREDSRDALVVRDDVPGAVLHELPHGAIIGTSSLRRRAQLKALRPDCTVVDLRGNVGTRLSKLDKGLCHAAILAAAGLNRLGLSSRIRSYLSAPEWLSAAGQGAIAIQVRESDAEVSAIVAQLNHQPTMDATTCERSFLAALDGGCQVPIGALMSESDGGRRMLHGLVAGLDGAPMLRASLLVGADVRETAIALAAQLKDAGASAILAEARAITTASHEQRA